MQSSITFAFGIGIVLFACVNLLSFACTFCSKLAHFFRCKISARQFNTIQISACFNFCCRLNRQKCLWFRLCCFLPSSDPCIQRGLLLSRFGNFLSVKAFAASAASTATRFVDLEATL